jgi:L-fuconolactonase
MMANTIIDAHGHTWTYQDDLLWKSQNTPGGCEYMVYTAEDVLARMDEYDIDRTTLVATPIHGRGSPYVRRCLEAYPDTFYGVVLLDYFADDIDDQVREAFEYGNLLGVRLGARQEYGTLWQHPDDTADWITSERLTPFWEAIESYEDPQVQVLLRPRQLEDLESIITAHPDVTFVLDHLAWPYKDSSTEEGPYTTLSTISEHSNAYIKVAHTPSNEPYPFEDIHEYVRYALEQFGSDRMLWGSDYIYHFDTTTYWESLHFLEEVPSISRGDLRDIRHRTFESIAP